MKIKESQERIAIALEGILQELKKFNEPSILAPKSPTYEPEHPKYITSGRKGKKPANYTRKEDDTIERYAEDAMKQRVTFNLYCNENWETLSRELPGRDQKGVAQRMYKMHPEYRQRTYKKL